MSVWYYRDGDTQMGPIGLDEIQKLAASGVITRNTPVWSEGMTAWTTAGTVAGIFASPPPIPEPVPPPASPTEAYGPVPPVNNHLTKAILATVLCCMPLGIVAIVKSAQVNGRLGAGDYSGALRLSQEADTWANWSIGIGLATGFIYMILALIGVATDS